MASPALAQIQTPIRDLVTFGAPANSSDEGMTAMRQASDRGGVTLLVNAGLGIQRFAIAGESDSGTGLAGLNFGAGGFVRPNLAVLGRFSGTSVRYFDDTPRIVSGVVGGTAQFWVHERVAIEAGGGLSFVTSEDDLFDQERGWGLILGASAVLLRSSKHNLLAGFEYAPAFFSDESFGESFTIHNLGFTVGYQFSVR
jgi:hypothetical protein